MNKRFCITGWYFSILILLLYYAECHAQQEPVNRTKIQVGDKVPDLFFSNVLQYKLQKAKLSDFKGKLVILDFWSTTCSGCIEGFPKAEALQRKFGDKIQILLVNPNAADSKYDSKLRIDDVLKRLKGRTEYTGSLPMPVHDTILKSYFPFRLLPHIIWIDKTGTLIGITDQTYLNEQNIKNAVEEKDIDLPQKNDWSFDVTKPFLLNGNGGNEEEFITRSIFTRYRPGIGVYNGLRRTAPGSGNINGVYIINYPLSYYLALAYPEINKLSKSQIIYAVEDKAKFFNDDHINTFCYDAIISPVEARNLNISELLREDLKRAFNVSLKREKGKLKVLVFNVTHAISKSCSKYTESDLDLRTESKIKHLRGFNADEIVNFLKPYISHPLINECALNKKIDIDFPDHCDMKDEKAVIEVLKKAGFEVNEEEREMEVVVITDKN